ncbi:two-component system, OmpR family, sensor histidine kinase TctE [Duganella sp. CF458]|uniref:sensor histidine kinase n=1 Tax=Duganella sp. CF458 TaxID=1884368 RepID=UPI0008F0826E|nr:sensor histidine kinase [Duganella sp. CF458]SFG34311.1 two-component system, OmpR family, sensor histidine kinase TctE [Duganella sp. CF458]
MNGKQQAADWDHAPAAEENEIQHSLFGEILDWMLAPLLLLWPMSIAITYLVAKSIANQPFDHALEDTVTVLTQQVREVAGAIPRLPGPARDILRADDVDNIYYQISAPSGSYVDGDRDLPPPPRHDPELQEFRSGEVIFRNANLHGTPIRIAYTWVNMEEDKALPPRLALVQVGETLEKRAKLANEIIKGVILPQFIILPIVLALVWFALSRGLLPLRELQERIRARPSDDLSPIPPRQVPEEITPLVKSLNEMLERLKLSIDSQKRFIADAAHQMKTPLAGMRTQSELALRQTDQAEVHRSLEQLAKSSEAATRLVNQLLALARAENQPQAGTAMEPLQLGDVARNTVHDWVQASFNYGIDLGYEPPHEEVPISGNSMMLREMLSNLIDNALRYTPRAGAVTVRVRRTGRHALLEVEDNGPGIPAAERGHVFERFYRILGSNTEGSGLGLPIVREVAQQHDAEVDLFANPRTTDPKYPGCLFRVTFPLRVPDAPPEEEEVPHFG